MSDRRLPYQRFRDALEGISPAPWHFEVEYCDCGDMYPCGHGSYRSSLSVRTAHPLESFPEYNNHISEVGDLTDADANLIEKAPELVAEAAQRLNWGLWHMGLTADRLRQLAERLPEEGVDLDGGRDHIGRDFLEALADKIEKTFL